MPIPAIPVIYTMLAGFMGAGLFKIIVAALKYAGIFAISYYMSDTLSDYLFSKLSLEFNSLPSKVFQIAGILGILQMINILLAFISVSIAFKFMNSSNKG